MKYIFIELLVKYKNYIHDVLVAFTSILEVFVIETESDFETDFPASKPIAYIIIKATIAMKIKNIKHINSLSVYTYLN